MKIGLNNRITKQYAKLKKQRRRFNAVIASIAIITILGTYVLLTPNAEALEINTPQGSEESVNAENIENAETLSNMVEPNDIVEQHTPELPTGEDTLIADTGPVVGSVEEEVSVADTELINGSVEEIPVEDTGAVEKTVEENKVKNFTCMVVPNVVGEQPKNGYSEMESNTSPLKMSSDVQNINRVATRANTLASGYDFSEDITSIKVQANIDGEWGALDEEKEYKDKDEVKVEIKYEITHLESPYIIYYQLPKELLIPEEIVAGDVKDKQDGTKVGTYVINQDKQLQITFDSQLFDVEKGFKGTFEYEAKLDASQVDDTKKIIIFDEFENGITIKFKSESEVEIKPEDKTDIKVEKEAQEFNYDDKEVKYKIIIRTNQGTSDTINLWDTIDSTGAKALNGKYSNLSIQKFKADNSEDSEELNYNPIIKNKEESSNFSYQKLPKLNAGERYEITYTVKLSDDIQVNNLVKNKAVVKSGKDSSEDENKYRFNFQLEKRANYKDNVITWIVTVKNNKLDLAGKTITDCLKDSNGNVIKITNIKVGKSLKELKTENVATDNSKVSFLYTFPEGSTNDTYTITYTTGLEVISSNSICNYNNTVTLDGEQATCRNTVTGEITYDITKDLVKENKQNGVYSWKSTIKVPQKDEIHGKIIFKDNISTSSSLKHYTDKEVINLKVTCGGVSLDPKEYNIQYLDNYQVLNNPTANTRVSEFDIEFPEATLENYEDRDIIITYNTKVDLDGTKNMTKYIINNQSKILIYQDDKFVGEKTDSAEAVYYKGGIEKSSSISENGAYYTSEKSYKYEELTTVAPTGKHLLYYRIKLLSGDYWNEEEKSYIGPTDMKDILPQGTQLKSDSIKVISLDANANIRYKEEIEYGIDGEKFTINLNECVSLKEGESNTIEIQFDEDKIKDIMKPLPEEAQWVTDALKGLCIQYAVEIEDPTNWNEELLPNGDYHKVFQNTVKYSNQEVTNKVTIQHNQTVLNKTSTLVSDEESSNQVPSNRIRSVIDINQSEMKLGDIEKITVIDTMSISTKGNAKAVLDINSIQLWVKDGDEYQEISSDQFKKNGKYYIELCGGEPEDEHDGIMDYFIKLEIPNGYAYRLQYDYTYQTNNLAGELSIKNTVSLKGYDIEKTVDNIKVVNHKSSAGVERDILTVYKIDAENRIRTLSGAKFRLYLWSNNDWKEQKDEYRGAEYLVTDENGMIELNVTGNLDQLEGISYKLEEVTAPNGYVLDNNPSTYFHWGKLPVSSKYPSNIESTKIETKRDVIYITNRPKTLEINKMWAGDTQYISEGHPSEIDVDILRSIDQTNWEKACSITLTEAENWTKMFNFKNKQSDIASGEGELYLPMVNENNREYQYKVEEVVVPLGYKVTYANNEGVSDGIITITNTRIPYELPSTGGLGTRNWGVYGIFIMCIGCMLLSCSRKEKKD